MSDENQSCRQSIDKIYKVLSDNDTIKDLTKNISDNPRLRQRSKSYQSLGCYLSGIMRVIQKTKGFTVDELDKAVFEIFKMYRKEIEMMEKIASIEDREEILSFISREISGISELIKAYMPKNSKAIYMIENFLSYLQFGNSGYYSYDLNKDIFQKRLIMIQAMLALYDLILFLKEAKDISSKKLSSSDWNRIPIQKISTNIGSTFPRIVYSAYLDDLCPLCIDNDSRILL